MWEQEHQEAFDRIQDSLARHPGKLSKRGFRHLRMSLIAVKKPNEYDDCVKDIALESIESESDVNEGTLMY